MATNRKTVAKRNNENMSIPALLNWINKEVNKDYTHIQDLSNGISYCQLIELLFPGVVDVQLIKIPAKQTYDKANNLALLQEALRRLDIGKTVPTARILRGVSQECYNFLLWFYIFCNTQKAVGHRNDLENVLKEKKEKNKSIGVVRPILFRGRGKKRKSLARVAIKLTKGIAWSNVEAAINDDDGEPMGIRELQSIYDDLENRIDTSEWDRNEAYNKLRKIEILIHESIDRGHQVNLCNWLLSIIESKTDSYVPLENIRRIQDRYPSIASAGIANNGKIITNGIITIKGKTITSGNIPANVPNARKTNN